MGLSETVKQLLDEAIVRNTVREDRDYLGVSILGYGCLRKIQYSWKNAAPDSPHSAKTLRIFQRGHLFEEMVATYLRNAGFELITEKTRKLEDPPLDFMEGNFGGHTDGIIVSGPAIEGLSYPFLWENKAVGVKSWTNLIREVPLREKDNTYAVQIAVYQAMLGLPNPALFTVVNSNTMEIHCEFVELETEYAQKALDRACLILSSAKNELLPRVSNDSDYFECKMCSYRNTCWE